MPFLAPRMPLCSLSLRYRTQLQGSLFYFAAHPSHPLVFSGYCIVHTRCEKTIHPAVPENDPEALKHAVARQPIAAAVQANERSFQLYQGGVLTDECGTDLDHGILIVGYGRENGTDFWLIKNSWGKYWGEDGYIKIERQLEKGPGQCGIASMPSYPIKTSDNPPRPPKPGLLSYPT
jgi:hypothetical protein